MYADNHELYETGEDLAKVKSSLAVNAEKASRWCEVNLLKGNFSKYKTMLMHNDDKVTTSLSLNIQGNEIELTDKLPLLDVSIDCNLNFSDHINSVTKKASQRIGVLMRLKNLIPTAAKLQLYKAAILPHLTYCHLTWHFCRESDRRKLERIQERGLRAMFNDKQSGYEELLVKANLPSLYNRRIQDILILMYKVKFKLLRQRILDLLTLSTSPYNTRYADFILPTVTFGKHSLRYTGPKLWNKLSSEARNIPSLKQFKLHLQGRSVQYS